MIDEPDPDERTPEEAFRAEYEFRGTKLKPFSFVRETAAHALGWKLHLPKQDEDESAANVGLMLWDAILVVWLCLQPDSVVQRVRRLPNEYAPKIDAWADKEKISLMSESGQEAMQAYGKLLTDYFSSQSEPKIDEDRSEDPN